MFIAIRVKNNATEISPTTSLDIGTTVESMNTHLTQTESKTGAQQ